MNLHIFSGRLTADVDVKTNKKGDHYANINLAIKSLGKFRFFRFMAYGEIADAIKGKRKGDYLWGLGEPTNDSYEDKKTGQVRYTTWTQVRFFEYDLSLMKFIDEQEEKPKPEDDDVPF